MFFVGIILVRRPSRCRTSRTESSGAIGSKIRLTDLSERLLSYRIQKGEIKNFRYPSRFIGASESVLTDMRRFEYWQAFREKGKESLINIMGISIFGTCKRKP